MHLIASVVALCLVSAEPTATPADIDRFFRLSGLGEQLAQTPALVTAGFEGAIAKSARGLRVDPRYVSGIRDAIPAVYAAERVVGAIRDQLLKNVDPAALRATLDWYQSDFSQKVTALEVKASTPEGQAELRSYVATLAQHPPTAKRAVLIRALDKATHGSEAGLDVLVGTTRGTLTAAQALLPKERRLDPMQAARLLGALRDARRPGIEERSFQTNAFVYRSLTDAELARYIAFYASAPGVSMVAKANEAANLGFNKLAGDLGDIAAALATKYPPQPQAR